MKIIVGLGNPGLKYDRTRHNMGFMVIDQLASRLPTERKQNKLAAQIQLAAIGRDKVLLVKPQTYMNHSGQAVRAVTDWFKTEIEDLLVVYDDMDIETGLVKIKPKGGSGGHKGMTSVIQQLGGQDFARIRIGIGRPPDETIDWVLGGISKAEKPILLSAAEKAADAAVCWVQEGINSCMNKYN